MCNSKNVVCYKDFGAVGDGVANDFEAIKRAHDYANENGLPVTADAGATYYIGRTYGEFASIKTDTDFLDAKFLIDDTVFNFDDPDREAPLFRIAPERERVEYGPESEIVKAINAAGGIKSTDEKLAYTLGYDAMLVPYNNTRMVYRRLGATSNPGSAQHEVIFVDKNGYIHPDTPVLIDYDKVTSVTEFKVDDAPITVKGGFFTTRANAAPREYTYYMRGILINRSNTVVKNLYHDIVDQTETGAPYHGFISVDSANHVLVEKCVLTGHKTYRETSGRSYMGTYDINLRVANDVTFKDCMQTNFYTAVGAPSPNGHVWGIMGSNYCKNITYDGCLLTRLDAHAGVYNATIKNSTITYIRLTGGGTFRIEDSKIYGNELVSLRADYGCTWRGPAIIKNCTLVNGKTVNLFSAKWQGYHNFGYDTYLPQEIFVDNLTLTTPADVYIFNDPTPDRDADMTAKTTVKDGVEIENVNPMVLPKSVKIKRNETNLAVYGSMGKTLNSQLEIVEL